MPAFERVCRGTRLCAASVVALLAVGADTGVARGQTPGDSVNMVSGTTWPGGNPFLQRQNEPSLAVSTRNPQHLLAGANDYRTVDLPAGDVIPGAGLAGDAWLGIFKSYDGGQTWSSTLLPGYPQDRSVQGLASPLSQLGAAADPTTRAGTHGLFYMSGMAFNRLNNVGVVFVSRFIDANNRENGDPVVGSDPIRYLGATVVDAGTSGQFLDKPWLGVDLPRPGAPNCIIPIPGHPPVPAGNVYLVWSRFTGATSTKIMFSRSIDCGVTWQNPIKVSEGNAINQGTVVAIDPNPKGLADGGTGGTIYLAWRRFAAGNQSDAILFAKSTDFGKTFTKAEVVANIIPFDQGMTSGSFRTQSMPSLAVSVDALNVSRVHLVWSGRAVLGGDARIRISSSSNGGAAWSAPALVDDAPIVDDFGTALTRGHQFMPSATFNGGLIEVLYYDTRLDHTVGLYTPNSPFVADGNGRFYREKRDPRAELLTAPGAVHGPYLTDSGLTVRRHTLDLRVAQAPPAASLVFTTANVSRYRFGTRDDVVSPPLVQLDVNPPNFPLFQQGTTPFIGDYIDVAGLVFLPPAIAGGPWRWNTAPSAGTVHYAVWTSNQDVRPPVDGNWAHYTPVGSVGAVSITDGVTPTPVCLSGQEGMRNQNIYVGRITQGLVASALQNNKALSGLERAFAFTVQNQTGVARTFRLTIAGQPPGGNASLLPAPAVLTTLDIMVGARSGAARSVYATSASNNPEDWRLTVNVTEVSAIGGGVVAAGLSSAVTFNADVTVPPLISPIENGPNPDIAVAETYGATITSPLIQNVNATPQTLTNGGVRTGGVRTGGVRTGGVRTGGVRTGGVRTGGVRTADLANFQVENGGVRTSTASNTSISNGGVRTTNVSDSPITDAAYSLTNTGNTSISYRVRLVGKAPAVPIQLIVSTNQYSPTSRGCLLVEDEQDSVLASMVTPAVTTAVNPGDPAIPDGELGNVTVAMAPGETVQVTLRGAMDCGDHPCTPAEAIDKMTELVTEVAPVIVPHPSNNQDFAAPLFITSETGALPMAWVGVPYGDAQGLPVGLRAIGGAQPYSWSLLGGQLPTGLTLGSSGALVGTPGVEGVYSFVAQVTDSSAVPQTAHRTITLTVSRRHTTTRIVSAPGSLLFGETGWVTLRVEDSEPTGARSTPTGQVSLTPPPQGLAPSCQLVQESPGVATCSMPVQYFTPGTLDLSAEYPGDLRHYGSSGGGVPPLVVRRRSTSTVISVPPVLIGQPSIVTITVSDTSVAPIGPTGTVTLTTPNGTASCDLVTQGATGSCAITVSHAAAGSLLLWADYPGDAEHEASAGSGTLVVLPAETVTTIVSHLPDPSLLDAPVTVSVRVATVSPATGTPTGIVIVNDPSGVHCTIALDPAGQGSCAMSLATVGPRILTAAYAGSADFLASTGSASHSVGFIFSGFLAPLSAAGTLVSPTFSGTFGLGRAVPLKWQVTNGAGVALQDLGTVNWLKAFFQPAVNGACPAGIPGSVELRLYNPTSYATGGSTFRSSDSQFIFNWDSSPVVGTTGAGCYTIALQLSDGSPVKATTILLN